MAGRRDRAHPSNVACGSRRVATISLGAMIGSGILVLQGAFALVGLCAYLEILVDVPARPVAIVAAALVGLDIVGTKRQVGRGDQGPGTVIPRGILSSSDSWPCSTP